MSDNHVVPEAAVGAAVDTLGPRWFYHAKTEVWHELMRAALEAAAPHMLAGVNTRVEQVNLPNGTVILSEQGGVFQHFNGYWFEPGSSYRHHLDDITLPATVIHRPAP